MRPAQLRRFAVVEAIGKLVLPCIASMRPAQLRRFARVCRFLAGIPVLASMRPAQLRRFAICPASSCRWLRNGFNEAGAAAPVCHLPGIFMPLVTQWLQ